MHIHAVAGAAAEEQLKELMARAQKRPQPVPFEDPIREFAKSSYHAGTVRNWLTLPLAERMRIVKDEFLYQPKGENEDETAFKTRALERWRALCVIIQEESRAPREVQSVEVAIGALKQLFPNYDWKKPWNTR